MKYSVAHPSLSLLALVFVACSDPVVDADVGGRDAGVMGDTTSDITTHVDTGTSDVANPATTDSDNDRISDFHEGNGAADTDMDGMPDSVDTDSDNDGLLDVEEAGDSDLSTPPVDTDMDGIPDFRDRDSDGDGVTDADEVRLMTNPRSRDTDMDGVDDLVEIAAMTNPRDPASNPSAMGNFFFREPYMAAPSPNKDTLVFATALRRADVHFAIDTSVSMGPIINQVRSALSTTIIPGVRRVVMDSEFGVWQFDRCPAAALTAACVGIQVEQPSTGNAMLLDTALGRLSADCGAHEPYGQTVWLWATGNSAMWPSVRRPTCPMGSRGLGCVRDGALPILVVFGDERFSESYNVSGAGCTAATCATCDGRPTVAQIVTAVNAISGKVIVMGTGASSPEWTTILTQTRSVNAMGMPLIFPSATAANVHTQLVNAIQTLANEAPRDVSVRAVDVVEAGETVDATRFIDRIVPNTMGGARDPRMPMRVCVPGQMTRDANMDGVQDTFVAVRNNVPVCFDIYPKQNDFVMPTDRPQLFRARIEVVGDGVTVLDTRDVFFLVPPRDPSGPIG
ncbi:MAG: hypothetical protein Q8Q09_05365 [Deltaproteobacteria bacterium]|nr:hypothetical protein [Deltaproteobacteria bacterium]